MQVLTNLLLNYIFFLQSILNIFKCKLHFFTLNYHPDCTYPLNYRNAWLAPKVITLFQCSSYHLFYMNNKRIYMSDKLNVHQRHHSQCQHLTIIKWISLFIWQKMKKNIVSIPDLYSTHCHDYFFFFVFCFLFCVCTHSPNLSWAINLQTVDIGSGIPLCSREVLAGTYIIQKKFQVWWEELVGWVASFSYHVVCGGFL